ncbi:putative circadian clock protein, KaiC [Methanosalsum zhilinae DSM 4017]|uniref:non-specific serine/threonine protein kinase n=1 Tax=Methanosalsum zhilinae (strain DSM 4017 / NBRC 107636 / OCM 62 / WeN5) TaxID=679901 RepID=F7XLQ7_METZD|nr:ATPase domain-containing protein [Methanosalsum zhilinae]AEH60850.1 putative circadian clock protein, KaiC [Methanosalsum zhilinae DSM 4017]
MERIQTKIPNLDMILNGGIPEYSINIIAGKPGTGKTILVQQMIFNNAAQGKKSIYLTTVSEPSVKVVRFQREFDYFNPDFLGEYVIYADLGEIIRKNGSKGALDSVTKLIEEHSPDFLVIDSFKAIHDLVSSQTDFRNFMFELAVKLSSWNTTTFLVGEYSCNERDTLPEFSVADSMICLKYDNGSRNIEIKKMRGTSFLSGKHTMKIDDSGITIYPHLKPELRISEISDERSEPERVSTGVPGLDTMLGGGLLQRRATLVIGSAGTGKSLMGLHFLAEGAKKGENGILLSFEERADEVIENSHSYGINLEDMIKKGLITILHIVPVDLSVDEMIYRLKETIEHTGAKRIVIDGIANIERNQTSVEIRDTFYTIVDMLKEHNTTSILTSEVSEIIGSTEATKHGTSFVVDTIISLRYVEIESEMKKAVSIIKMRGSDHDKEIREYKISDKGISVELPFAQYSGVFSGTPSKKPSEAFVEAFKK